RREADVLFHDLRAFPDQILAEQGHEKIELLTRAFPVFAAQAEKSELADAQPATFLHRGANALDTAAMALDPRQAALPRPAAVAVHDDGNVPRQPGRIKTGGGHAFQGVGLEGRSLRQGCPST